MAQLVDYICPKFGPEREDIPRREALPLPCKPIIKTFMYVDTLCSYYL